MAKLVRIPVCPREPQLFWSCYCLLGILCPFFKQYICTMLVIPPVLFWRLMSRTKNTKIVKLAEEIRANNLVCNEL